MSMTKFSAADDAGYVRVHDQLWLWTSEIETAARKQATSTDKVHANHDVDGTVARPVINSGGGPVIQGYQTAGRDVNISFASQNAGHEIADQDFDLPRPP